MPGTQVDQLVAFLTDGADADSIAADLRRWIAGSRPFRAFVERHRDKIRKKLRTAGSASARLDVRAELAVAHALLADRRMELAYERAGATVGGPDFAVGFRGHPAFNLEVTRWRGERAALERLLVAKLRQLPPSVPNAILVAVDGAGTSLPDVGGVVARLRTPGPTDRERRQRLARLGGIYLWSELRASGPPASMWENGDARISLPGPAARAVLRCLEAASDGP